jgi:hypothetical protein
MVFKQFIVFRIKKTVLVNAIFWFLIGFQFCQLHAQENKALSQTQDSFDIKGYSFLLPQALPNRKYHYSLSIYYVVPPTIWTLDMVKAPMFNYTGKYGLGKSFNIEGGISTLIISNRINAGPIWNYKHNNHHFGLGYQVAFNLGVLKQFGFNSVLTGWEQQPSITYGYSFKKSALIFRTDLYYTSSLVISEGGNKIPSSEKFLNGFSVTSSYEQRLTKNRVMSLGLKIDYLRYHILAWPALPVNSYRYFFPEFQVGLNF